jgi:hypothetical protein
MVLRWPSGIIVAPAPPRPFEPEPRGCACCATSAGSATNDTGINLEKFPLYGYYKKKHSKKDIRKLRFSPDRFEISSEADTRKPIPALGDGF